MEVLLVSPIRPIFIILAKAVPYLILSCVNVATILFLAVYVLHVPVAGSLWTLSFLSLLLIAVALSLGLLISCLVESQVAAMLVSGMMLMMPVMLLSGRTAVGGADCPGQVVYRGRQESDDRGTGF